MSVGFTTWGFSRHGEGVHHILHVRVVHKPTLNTGKCELDDAMAGWPARNSAPLGGRLTAFSWLSQLKDVLLGKRLRPAAHLQVQVWGWNSPDNVIFFFPSNSFEFFRTKFPA